MTTRIGFFLFAGLVLGTIGGYFLFGSPAPSALAGAILGLIFGGLLDYRDWRNEDDGEGDGE